MRHALLTTRKPGGLEQNVDRPPTASGYFVFSETGEREVRKFLSGRVPPLLLYPLDWNVEILEKR
jgi:hypothetical protein